VNKRILFDSDYSTTELGQTQECLPDQINLLKIIGKIVER